MSTENSLQPYNSEEVPAIQEVLQHFANGGNVTSLATEYNLALETAFAISTEALSNAYTEEIAKNANVAFVRLNTLATKLYQQLQTGLTTAKEDRLLLDTLSVTLTTINDTIRTQQQVLDRRAALNTLEMDFLDRRVRETAIRAILTIEDEEERLRVLQAFYDAI